MITSQGATLKSFIHHSDCLQLSPFWSPGCWWEQNVSRLSETSSSSACPISTDILALIQSLQEQCLPNLCWHISTDPESAAAVPAQSLLTHEGRSRVCFSNQLYDTANDISCKSQLRIWDERVKSVVLLCFSWEHLSTEMKLIIELFNRMSTRKRMF